MLIRTATLRAQAYRTAIDVYRILRDTKRLSNTEQKAARIQRIYDRAMARAQRREQLEKRATFVGY